MNRKQMKSLISAGVFAASLLSGLAYADDKPMDPNMPMDTTTKNKPMDPSMPMNTPAEAKSVDHKKHKDHKKHLKEKKPMDKDMPMPADSK